MVFLDSGISPKHSVRDSGNVNGIGDLTAPGKGDAPKFGHEMGDWEKKGYLE